MAQTRKSVLLPRHIKPIHYNIYLEPDLENFTFQGEEEIKIKVSKPTSKIKLHSAEIEIFSVHLVSKKDIKAQKIDYDEHDESVEFVFDQKIAEGNYSLKIKFAGILNGKMRGFYRSRYEHKGKTYHMGVTQFESTDARRAFPSFDEPEQKATFDVALQVPTDRTVISNTLETEIVEHTNGFKTVKFATSPKMSSYLLAFIVGHFEHIQTTTPEGVLVRVYTTPGKKRQAKFALETAAKVMSFFHHYFGIAYPLPAMDLIAIPDFANGAMENWGAVTYRETALLVDEESSSLHTKQWVALIIAHELAHQWFGNLVTMKWWTHLWLNEGFASFMEYLAVDKLFPEWKVWTQFVYTEHAKALSLDGLENTHAIEIPVHHPGEISEIFDAVSYSKGASVIRMIEDFVGEKNFQKGLQNYLKTHKYANAETEDLWRALEKVSGQPVRKIMKNWTAAPGYPLVSLEKKGDTVVLTQERFFSSPRAKNRDFKPWLIPYDLISDDKKSQVKVLIDKKSVKVKGFSKSSWVKGNADEAVFARTRYTEQNLKLLEEPVLNKDKKLGEEGRFGLIRDAFAQVEAGYLEADEALRLTHSYKNDDSYIVWAEIVTHLLEFNYLLFGTEIYDDFQKYGRDLLSQIIEHVGFKSKKGEDHFETLLRSAVLYTAGALGDKNVIKTFGKMFEDFEKSKKIDANLKGAVFALIAENGGKREYKKFEKIYLNEGSEEEKDRALRAMTSFKDEDILKEVLRLTFSENVRAQDAFKSIYLMAGNPYATDLTWEYVKTNWEAIAKKFAGGHLFSRFILPFAKFKNNKRAKEIEVFFERNKTPGLSRTVAQTVEKIRSNSELIKRNYKNIKTYLEKELKV